MTIVSMPDEQVDLGHHPAVALFLVVAVFASLFTTIVNLRNARLWVLQVMGRRAYGR